MANEIKVIMPEEGIAMGQRCYNRYCLKVLTEDDFPKLGIAKGMNFGEYHLCDDCFRRFDAQKMAGRWKMIGLPREGQVAVAAFIERDCGSSFNLPQEGSTETRYTESLSEWIEQGAY